MSERGVGDNMCAVLAVSQVFLLYDAQADKCWKKEDK